MFHAFDDVEHVEKVAVGAADITHGSNTAQGIAAALNEFAAAEIELPHGGGITGLTAGGD